MMRIISKFQDYYDGVQAYGMDKEHTYVRHSRTLKEFKEITGKSGGPLKAIHSHKAPSCPNFEASYSPRGVGNYHRHLIAFCGKLYIIYEIDHQFYKSIPAFFKAVDTGTSVRKFGIDIHSKREQLKKHRKFVAKARAQDAKDKAAVKKVRWGSDEYRYRTSELGWEKWLENNRDKLKVPDQVHLDWNAPVIVIGHIPGKWSRRKEGCVLNPCLKDLGFQKLVDPFTAYQELDMYLGNNMANQMDPTTTRTQEDIRDSKGFDKWSFKNPSPGRKKRKQKK